MRDNNYSDNATIVRLSPSENQTMEVATFEEAFGEHSNLHGKGRARRAKRKAARQANRQKKRMTRIQNRQVRKSTRKANRQANKQHRVESRLTRKATRKASRNTGEDETDTPADQEDETASTPDASGQTQDATNDLDTPSKSSTDDGSEQSEAPAEEGSDSPDESDQSGQDESNDSGEEEPDYGFSGEEAESSFNSEINDDGAPRQMQIHPAVMDTARKIVWNEQLVSNLEGQLGQGGNDNEIHGHIQNRQDRIEKLESMLGDYSEATGKHSAARAAKKAARKELHAAKAARKGKGKKPQKGTPVAESLHPDISQDEISIPAEETESGADGTGSDLLSSENPNQVSETRKVELTSNASGPLSTIDWKTVGITAGVVAGILILLKVTKVL